ncbi:xanthine dehydrogenase family Fe-S subunit [Azorhizobium doebereinerae]|uniref:xanthine dehydrogenase family Fe-S subunit n=1 Tax=Azorhizobium doebereinerae TaxID=281091 RepID=UPI00040858AF|nr:2Fe-2S iron-sulfur cluster-binding protein [Azorhizobium doebereinerae]
MNAPLRQVPEGAVAVALTVNGRPVAAQVEPRTHLADFVREDLNLTGTHLGCEHGVCGACTVLLDGEPARACLAFAATCGGACVTTIEGLDGDEVAGELRAAFNREHALQCGFCTPGMLVSARDLVLRLPEADERRVRLGLSGNLCRCTGYVGIVRAVMSVIADRRARGIAPQDGAARALGPVGAHAGDGVGEGKAVSAPPTAAALPPVAVEVVEDFIPAHTFAQSFSLAQPPDAVFAAFADVRAVAACLPGAFVEAEPAPGTVAGGLKVQIGPVAATFRGQARITRDPATRTGRIVGAGADVGGRSSTQGEVRYRVRPGQDPGSAVVELTVGYTLKGPLAQFGRPGLVRDIAGRLTALFAANLEARLAGAPAPAAAPPLNPFALALGALAARLARWRARLTGG